MSGSKPRGGGTTRAREARDTWRCGFVDGAFVEVLGDPNESYRVEFIDSATNRIVHQGTIRTNHWIRTARQYFTDWQINAYRERDGSIAFSHRYRSRGRNVYVAFESKALGDTLAWLPAVEEFRRTHHCKVICSTFMNDLVRDQYRSIRFVEPGTTVHDLYAMYRVGWFYRDDGEIDENRNVGDFRERPLGATAFDILGLPYREIRPRLEVPVGPRPIAGPYVCIGVHATAQAKYWNNAGGWSEVIRFLTAQGYQVILLSREGLEYMGNTVPGEVFVVPPGPIERVIHYLAHAAMFIGVGSGLTWLAWAVGCPTCLISGFSLPHSEMADCIRIAPKPPVCTGCFNRYRLDAGDWNWCPEHKDTPRMFECSHTITSEQVIEAIRGHL